MVNSRGRPAGGGDARERLLAAAQRHVAAGDLDATSSRALAREAGVSHTLVNFHFDSRAGLVAEALAVRLAPHMVVEASTADGRLDARRLVDGLLSVWEHPVHGSALVRLARSAATGDSPVVQTYLQQAVFDRLDATIGTRRARRAAVAIVGLIFARYVLAVPTLATMPVDEARRLLLDLLGERT